MKILFLLLFLLCTPAFAQFYSSLAPSGPSTPYGCPDTNVPTYLSGELVCGAGGGGGGGSGTVTNVSGVNANGLLFSIANPTTTPAITLSTSVNGLVKGNGTSFSAATSGTDYSAGTSGLATGLLKSTTGTGALSIGAAGTDYQAPIGTSGAVVNQFLTGFTAPNTFTRAQPAFTDISGQATAAQMLTLPSANFYVGTAGSVPAAVAMSSEASLANTGAVTLSNAAVIGKVLTGFSAGAGVVAATDTILQAFNKIVGNAASYLSSALATNHIFVGSAGGVATDVSMSGDAAIVASGAITVQPNVISNSKLAQAPTLTLKGNNTGGTADESDLTVAQVNTMLGTVTNVTGTAPVVSSGGATPAISMPAAATAQDGFLTSIDWNTFNGKQPAGNYITAITGDLVATGPGSVPGVMAVNPDSRYVDFLVGNDADPGTSIRPWKTIQHACTTLTGLATINQPYTVYISGGNNDSDAAPITCPPNLNFVAAIQTQISQPFTITGGATNDGVTFTNLTFVGAVTWIRNDFTIIGMTINNSQFFSGPIFKQNGSGTANITSSNSVSVNMDLKTGGTGSFFTGHNFLGSTTFEDANTSAYYEILGGYVGGAMSIAGGPFAYFSGVQFDAPFGATLTTSTTANGTPVLQSDDASIPASITGPNTLALQSFSQHTSYTPAVGGNYSPAVTHVAGALDQLAARVPVGGSQGLPNPVVKTSAYTAVNNDTVRCDASGGSFNTTIPSAAANPHGVIRIKKVDVSANPCGAIPTGGDTLEFQVSLSFITQGDGVALYSDGISEWDAF